jgi:hypothetical protein
VEHHEEDRDAADPVEGGGMVGGPLAHAGV